MSELEKPDLETYAKSWDHPDRHVTVSEYNLGQVVTALNAAIERINELEAKFEGHTHIYDHFINGGTETATPPTNNVTRGGTNDA